MVTAADDVAVVSVTVAWTASPLGETGTLVLSDGDGDGIWRGDLVFAPGTFLTVSTLTITVTAADGAGNATTATVPPVVVEPCP